MWKDFYFEGNINMQIIRQRISSIPTKQDENMCQAFAQWIKFDALDVAPEENKGQVEDCGEEAVVLNWFMTWLLTLPLPRKGFGFPLDLLII